MLIPFLDILCSLIGVLILIIVVLCAAQMQRTQGRTREDIQLAQQYQTLLANKAELEKSAATLQAKLTELERLQADIAANTRLVTSLKGAADNKVEAERLLQQRAADLQKMITDLKVQIDTVVKSMPPVQTDIDRLKKELANRKKKPDEKPPSVIVQASGSGARTDQKLFFVETTGSGVILHKSKSQKVRIANASVGVDKEYDEFLATVKQTPNAAVIFLVRRDGWWTYNRAAGWAEQNFGISTSKLPIPGEGPVDLSLFEKS
jgi:chaperonin cofactor prefoldin